MPTNDTQHIARLVCWFLGLNSLILSGGVLVLSYSGQTIDGGLFGPAGAAIGGLATLLVNPQSRASSGGSRASDAPPVAVTVTNTEAQPVPVEEKDGA